MVFSFSFDDLHDFEGDWGSCFLLLLFLSLDRLLLDLEEDGVAVLLLMVGALCFEAVVKEVFVFVVVAHSGAKNVR